MTTTIIQQKSSNQLLLGTTIDLKTHEEIQALPVAINVNTDTSAQTSSMIVAESFRKFQIGSLVTIAFDPAK